MTTNTKCAFCGDTGLIDGHVCGCPAGDEYRAARNRLAGPIVIPVRFTCQDCVKNKELINDLCNESRVLRARVAKLEAVAEAAKAFRDQTNALVRDAAAKARFSMKRNAYHDLTAALAALEE